MNRIMIATALATTLSTAAFAATETQIQQIDAFAAGINTSVMTDAELDTAYGIISSGMSRAEKVGQLRSLAAPTDPSVIATLSNAEMQRLMDLAPEADFSTITEAQAQAALAVSYSSESRSETTGQVKAILNDYSVVDTMATEISRGQLNLIRSYAPDVNVSDLSEQDVLQLMSFIHSGMSHGEKLGKIESLLNS